MTNIIPGDRIFDKKLVSTKYSVYNFEFFRVTLEFESNGLDILYMYI